MELEEGLNFLKFLNRGGFLADEKSDHQKWISKINIKTTTDG